MLRRIFLLVAGVAAGCGLAKAQYCYTFQGQTVGAGTPVSLTVKLSNLGLPDFTSIPGEVNYLYDLTGLSGNSVSLTLGSAGYYTAAPGVLSIATSDISGIPNSTFTLEFANLSSYPIFGAAVQLDGVGNFFLNGLTTTLPPISSWLTSGSQFQVSPNGATQLVILTAITSRCGGNATNNYRANFFGNGKAAFAIWRPSIGGWFIFFPGLAPLYEQWGLAGDIEVSGDYDGDGKTDYAIWRPSIGTWYIIPSSNPGAPLIEQWGLAGDIPVPGDYDGDGKTDYAVWRPSDGTWYVIPSSNPGTPLIKQWGLTGDVPVTGDFDGDGKTDYAVWRPSDGTWYIVPSTNPAAPLVKQWGLSGDIPVPGDFDGDGKTDYAVWRPSSGTWFIIPSGNPNVPIAQQWGLQGDVPVAADYDGDGKTDYAVWRTNTGTWFVIPSGSPTAPISQQWGLPGDVPE